MKDIDFRLWRVTVFEIQYPVILLDTEDKFRERPALHWLWNSGIQHRDVSIGNMMFRMLPGRKVQGVLNDFDLAELVLSGHEKSTLTRTETKPFMAIDALNPHCEEYFERFD